MIRRHFYGWYRDGVFHLSQLPADAPVRPCTIYETTAEIRALLSRRGVSISWWPRLPEAIDAEIKAGLRVEGR